MFTSKTHHRFRTAQSALRALCVPFAIIALQSASYAEDVETHSLKVSLGQKTSTAELGSLGAQVLDIKGYQNVDRTFTWGLGVRRTTYDKSAPVSSGEGSDIAIDVAINSPRLTLVGTDFAAYLKLSQGLYSEHKVNLENAGSRGYDSEKFSRRATTVSGGLSLAPRWFYLYEYALTVEYGFAADAFTKRRAYLGGNRVSGLELKDDNSSGTEILIGLQLTH